MLIHLQSKGILTKFYIQEPTFTLTQNWLLTPKSGKHLISPLSISPKTNVKVTRIKEMIANSTSSWLLDTSFPCAYHGKCIMNSEEKILFFKENLLLKCKRLKSYVLHNLSIEAKLLELSKEKICHIWSCLLFQKKNLNPKISLHYTYQYFVTKAKPNKIRAHLAQWNAIWDAVWHKW